MNNVIEAYNIARSKYKLLGIDVDQVINNLKKIRISINCWQGDDVKGFLFKNSLSGGIQVTGNYPGASRNAEELRNDLSFALSLLPGKYNINLHAIYADTEEKVDLDKLEPKHFLKWVNWAKKNSLGLDFNPTCFSHPMASTGFTLSSYDENIRNFWVRHCIACRKISEYFGKELGIKSVNNLWIPDGSKDIIVDRLSPRIRLKKSLDEIYSIKVDPKYSIDSLESKLFGIGKESYTVGSNEFYLGYAVKNNLSICLDVGHFHPTEVISDKISSSLLFTNELLLHISRPVRWDSDHVVIFDDELCNIASELVRNNLLNRTHIALDYFDGSINRIASWVIGTRSMLKALTKAMLEPVDFLKQIELQGNYTKRLALLEELKSLPWEAVFDYYCFIEGVPVGIDWIEKNEQYEQNVLFKRK